MLKSILARITASASGVLPRRAARNTLKLEAVSPLEYAPDYGVFVWTE